MSDQIEIQGITGYGFHGVLPEERATGQTFHVDVSYQLDIREAAATDDLTATVSYAAIAERVHKRIEGEPVQLLERLAHQIADDVLIAGPIASVTVRVHKPQAPISVPFDDVTLCVQRSADEPLLEPRPAVLALGANLGDPVGMLTQVIAELTAREDMTVVAASPVVRSTAVGLTGRDESRPVYGNAVVKITTRRTPLALLEVLHEIENAHGRVRLERWGDRTLDLDIVDYAAEQWNLPKLTLPHPRAHERSFVIQPWLMVDPDATLPGIGPIRDVPAAKESLQ